jgi:hypothetical protein
MDEMMIKTATLAALGGALLMTAATSLPASAKIKCDGNGNQYNSAAGGYIPSPYCGDKLIAQISGYPFNGPNGVKQNPSVKAEACRFAGSNIKINHLCAGHLPEDDGSYRR